MDLLRRSLFVLCVFGSGCAVEPEPTKPNFSYIQCTRDTECAQTPGNDRPLYCTSDHLCAEAVPTQNLCSVGSPAPDANTLVVASLVDRRRPSDLAMEKSFILAIDEINRRPFDNPLPRIALVLCDTGSVDDQTVRAAQVAMGTFGARAFLGPTRSGNTRRLVEYLTISNIPVPVMTPSATAAELSTLPDGRRLWRTAFSDALQARVMVDAVRNDRRAPLRRVDVLYVDNLYGRSLANAFVTQYKTRDSTSPTLGRSEPYRLSPADPDNKDLQLAIENIRRDKPTHLVVIADPAEPVIQEFVTRAADVVATVALFLSDTGRAPTIPRTISSRVATLVRYRGSSPTIPTTEDAYLRFREAYEDAYPGDELDALPYAAPAYDAAYLLAIAAGFGIPENQPPSGPRTIPASADIISGLERILEGGGGPYNTVDDYGLAIRQILRGAVALRGVTGRLAFDLNGDLVGSTTYDIWGLSFFLNPRPGAGYDYLYGLTVP